MGKSTYNGTSPYEYVDFLERRNAELEAEVERLRNLLKAALRHVEDAGDDTLAAIIDTQIGSDTDA